MAHTSVLFPQLPGGVPLAVMFAWVLIVFGVYGWIGRGRKISGIGGALLGAALATCLDLEIEPVATRLEHYWEWLSPGTLNYYGVPLANFAAWFVVAVVLLVAMMDILVPPGMEVPIKTWVSSASYIPRIVYVASLFMFGLIDLTHGYYGATLVGLLAGGLLCVLSFFGFCV